MNGSLFERCKLPRQRPGAESVQARAGIAQGAAPGADAVAAPLLEVRRVRKCFAEAAGVVSADLVLRRGEIHAIVGANGCGKSTLVGIIAGVHTPDAGELRVGGAPVRFTSPQHARQHGIAVVHQESQFVPDLSVADNIFLGAELRYGRVPLVHHHQMYQRAAVLLRELGATFDPSVPLSRLGLAGRQLVAIARVLWRDLTLCILDEPTATLGEFETERLFAVLRRLREQGVGILYVSHRLDEVLTLADRVTIMRDGHTVLSIRVADVTREWLIGQFVEQEGFADQDGETPVQPPRRRIALQVEHLSRRNAFEDVSFQAASGEIYGLAGLTGSGRTRIACSLFGVEPPDDGIVRVYDKPVRIRSPRDAIKAGLGMLPEDREHDGLILCQPAAVNVALPMWERIAHGGLVTPAVGLRLASRLLAQLGTGVSEQGVAVAGLSGGNQQKIVLAKWFATLPKVLILDEPTRGVDVTAKAEIHALIRHIAAQGIAMVVICSELSELLNLADRVGVVRQGRLVAEFTRAAATQEIVLRHALGNVPAQAAEAGAATAAVMAPRSSVLPGRRLGQFV